MCQLAVIHRGPGLAVRVPAARLRSCNQLNTQRTS